MIRIILTLVGAILLATTATVWAINTQAPSEGVQAPEITQTVKDTDEAEKPVKKAEKKPETVKDPQGCEPEQFWAKDPPHDCIDKPVKQVAAVARSATTHGNCESYRSLLAQYSWNVETMLYAMKHESGCNPNAVGDQYTINGVYAPSCGLLQVRTLAGRPSCEALKNPATNISTAYAIWQGQGYRAWTVLH